MMKKNNASAPSSAMSDERTVSTIARRMRTVLAAGSLLGLLACPASDPGTAKTGDVKDSNSETKDGKQTDSKPGKDPRVGLDKKNLAKPADVPAPPDVAAAPADAIKTASGLAYKVLTKGKGTVHPKATDKVKVHYTGWMTNGKMFDSSVKRGRPATFGLNQVIKGWTEGVQLMTEGEKVRFWIPGNLAYGETEKRPGAPFGLLVFDVELLTIVKPVEAPSDVAAAPADATKTASGLAYKVLTQGSGAAPTAADTVEVHYSGWTTDGKMFDSSVQRGKTAKFPLKGVIKGWTEGVQLMKVGGKTRFWIPGGLAYGEKPSRPGAPAGLLVFDIELVSIQGK